MQLQKNILDEVFKWCLNDKEVAGIICENLSSADIPKDLKSYDTILAILKKHHATSTECMTLGELQQKFFTRGFTDEMVFERIRVITMQDKGALLDQLTEHLRQVKTVQAYEDFGENFMKSDKTEAVAELASVIKEIELLDFNVSSVDFVNPMLQLTETIVEAGIEDELSEKREMPFFIPPLDAKIAGIGVKDTALFILPSGGGKSTILKTISTSAVKRGFKGMHFQLEGGDKEVIFKYGSITTGLSYHKQNRGDMTGSLNKPRWIYLEGRKVAITSVEDLIALNESKMAHLKKQQGKYDLEVYSYETLGGATMSTIVAKLEEYIAERGYPPDFMVIDSIDLLDPGNGKKYSTDPSGIKAKIQACAQGFKNIATIYGTRILTATQTSDIKMEQWNDPNFVITRNHSMGDKNIANPFSFVFSGNRTQQEKRQNLARIYIDKLRHDSADVPVVTVATSFQTGKYVNVKKTVEQLQEFNDKQHIPEVDESKKAGGSEGAG